MFSCPRCRMPLVTTATPRGRRHVCRACSGHAVTYGGLRGATDPNALAALWRAAADPARRRHLACPSCLNRMTVVPLGTVEAPLHVDVCRACHMIWFDSGEEAQMPAAPSSDAALPAEVHAALAAWRKAEALLEVRRMQRDHERRAPPSNVVARFAGYLGLPVEENAPSLRQLPLVTWLLASVCVGISLPLMDAPAAYEYVGFLPADPWAHHGFGALTTFFAHGSFGHLVGNLAFLLVFGDNVEDLIGPMRYALLVAVGTACASLAHALVTTAPDAVLIGASGGISALVVFYALAFPEARLKLFFFSLRPAVHVGSMVIPPMFWLGVRVRYAVAGWLCAQFVLLLEQVEGRTSVSAAAHLGGCALGCVAWWLGRLRV